MLKGLYNKVMTMTMTLTMTLTMTSCVEEDLCELDHPHTSGVTFSYNWTDLKTYVASCPDSMYVLFNRVISQETFCAKMDSMGIGHYISVPDSAFLSAEQKEQLSGENRRYTLNSSYYRFTAVNDTSDVFDTSELKSYLSSASGILPDVSLTYKTFGASETALGTAWTDYNEYTNSDDTDAGFVSSSKKPIVIASTDVMEVVQGDSVNVEMKPSMVVHNIDMYFDIMKDVTDTVFVIDSVYVAVAGIPHNVSLTSGILDVSNTDKLLMKMRLVSPTAIPSRSSQEMTDTETNFQVRCSRDFNVTGIVGNNNTGDERYNGPGVLQLIVFCNIKGDDGTWTRKTINGLGNIGNALTQAGLQTYSYEKDYYTKNGEYTRLPININFTINKDVLTRDEMEGILKWDDK